MRCAIHGLVAADDGTCVLCRRRPRRAAPAILLGAVVLAAVAAGLVLRRRAPSPVAAAAVEPAPEPQPASAAPASDDELEALRERAVAEHERQRAALDAEQRRVVVAEAQRAAAETRRDAELARGRAEQEQLARAQAEQQRRLEAAVREVPIVLYTTSWCRVCAEARGFLAASGLRFVDHDVEAEPAARAVHRQLNPRGSVPTIDVDGQILVGFSPRSLSVAIERAARRRL